MPNQIAIDASKVLAAYSYENYNDTDLLKVGLNKTAEPAQWAVQQFINKTHNYNWRSWELALNPILEDNEFTTTCYDSRMNSLRELNYVTRSIQRQIGDNPTNDTVREIAPWLLHIARTRVRIQIALCATEHDVVTAALKQYKAEAGPQTHDWDYV